MSELDHSLLKWIVGDMSGWPPIATEIAEMAERFLDHPLSRYSWGTLSSLGSGTIRRPTSALDGKMALVNALRAPGMRRR